MNRECDGVMSKGEVGSTGLSDHHTKELLIHHQSRAYASRGLQAPPSPLATKELPPSGERAMARQLGNMTEPKSLFFWFYPFNPEIADYPGLLHLMGLWLVSHHL